MKYFTGVVSLAILAVVIPLLSHGYDLQNTEFECPKNTLLDEKYEGCIRYGKQSVQDALSYNNYTIIETDEHYVIIGTNDNIIVDNGEVPTDCVMCGGGN